MDVKLMMQTEVFEPFAPGRGSSSTMPQKRNPISCLYIHANISVVRQLAASLMDAMVADHERSTGPWEIEWVAMPEIFCLMAGAQADQIHPERTRSRCRADAPQHRPDARPGV
jgi:3-carboxy-cis,cis-muconate cycloisomerase